MTFVGVTSGGGGPGPMDRGIAFEHYEGTPTETDELGVFRGGGPLIAWFKDPFRQRVVRHPGTGELTPPRAQ